MRAFAGSLLVLGGFSVLLGACSATSTESSSDSSTNGITTAATSGTSVGGSSSVGGAGGEGGTPVVYPCGVDCATIQVGACFESVCNEQLAQCEVVPAAAGTLCDDGVFCTIGDSCLDGVCEAGPANDCGITPATCQVVSCDETSQMCSQTMQTNGEACVDLNDLCVVDATCSSGLCLGQQNDCFFAPVPDDCHVPVCNPQSGVCEPQVGNEGGSCTDINDLCTTNKTCIAGMCDGGNPVDCSAFTQGCNVGTCNTTTGVCEAVAVMNGDPCDDLDPCTSGELCSNGTCAGGASVTTCMSGDFCCPAGCVEATDLDCGTNDLDVGPYGSTYTSNSSTRGYWFQAPQNMTIKELRVPTDVGTGVQNVMVVQFTGPPALYPVTTTVFTTLAYVTDFPGTGYIPINVAVTSGAYIGILGARGTTSLANSYGQGNPYASMMFNQPVSLSRLIYQSNLNSTQPGPLSSENGGSYSRVEMKYGP